MVPESVVAEKEKAIKCLRLLRNLLTDDLNLKSPIHDERFLIRFVRAKKYDAALAHQSVRKYFRLRRKFKDLFENAYPNYAPLKEFLEANGVAKLKQDDPEGRHIIVVNARYWDVTKFNFDIVTLALTLIMDELAEAAQLNGVVFISDKEGFTSAHSRSYSLWQIKNFATNDAGTISDPFKNLLEGAMPIRVKQIHIIRENRLMEAIYAIGRNFLSEKMNQRAHVYRDEFPGVIESIGAERLPKTMGGTLSDEDSYDTKFRDRLFERDAYYRGLSEYGFGEGCSDEEDTYM